MERNFGIKLIFLLVLSSTLFSLEKFEIQREDGSQAVCYYELPKVSPFSITLIIPSSQKESVVKTFDSIKGDLLAINQCPVVLEKQGIDQDLLVDEKAYTESLSLKQRSDDHLLLLSKLKEKLSKWNGKISLLGQGDGGRIGAHLATKIKDLSALILIASGGLWPAQQELLQSFRRGMANDGYSPQYIQGFLVKARQEFVAAQKSPKVEHKAFGFTYKYWDSLFSMSLIEDLAALSCPIYSINGAKDDRVPVESVEAMAKHLEGKVTFIRKEEMGRELIQDHSVYKEAIFWLDAQSDPNLT
jgi:hypothetical protein